MKAMKKVLAFVLALAMVVTAVPVTNAAAKTANLSAGKTVNKTYYTGKTHTLKLTGVTKADVKSTTWKSSNAKVVKIVADSQTKVSAQFKCVKKGTATVTATVTLKNGKTKTYKAKITVKAPTLTVSPSAVNLTVGQTQAITVKKTPSGAKLTYTSSDPGVASISGKKITAHSAGKATITVQLTNGTKKITKKVDVTVSAATDGLTSSLTNPLSADDDYKDTVLIGQNAIINVAYVRNGKPVAGESIVMSIDRNKAVGTNRNRYVVENVQRDTDANGIATFVIRVNPIYTDVTVSNTAYAVNLPYTVQVQGGEKIAAGSVKFAAIGFSGVKNTNVPNTATALVPGLNYTGSNARAGVATTINMKGIEDEYVVSQQVSKDGGNEHAVTFDGGYPWIYTCGTSEATSAAGKGVQPVNYTSGKYGTYDYKGHLFALDEDPRKLTYATVNIEDLKLSKYSTFTVAWYASETAANNYAAAGSKTINGPYVDSSFGVQIPITDDITKLYIRVSLESPGQVDTAMNDGFKITTVDYVYRTITNGAGEKWIPMKNATITWEQVATRYSEEVTIDGAYAGRPQSSATAWNLIHNITVPEGGKLTVKSPVFPYTGMSILTLYDANNKVLKRYACPTVNAFNDGKNAYNSINVRNDGKQINVNYPQVGNGDWGNSYVYEISEDELRDMVGTVTQEGSVVTVNATKSGRTTLEGKITVNGEVLEGLDAECTAYTSVQWSPLPVAGPVTTNSNAFAALLGQSIEVVAQLVDVNGNKVSKSGQPIEFLHNGTVIDPNETVKLGTDTAVTKVDTTTDSNGQAKLVLKASAVQEILNITARDKYNQYNVILVIAKKETTKADLYWIDADLEFKYSCIGWPHPSISTSLSSPTRDTDSTRIQPTTGETWEYGVKVVGTTVGTGVIATKTININGLGITMAKAAGGVGTVTPIATGKVNATSIKAGEMKIVSRIDANSVTDNVTLSGADVTYAGIGKTSIRKTLNLIAEWKANGVTLQYILPTGTAGVTTGSAISKDVYVKVVDTNGNPWAGKEVTFKSDAIANIFTGIGTDDVVTSGSSITVKTNSYGIATATLDVANVTSTRRTTVTASVAGADVIADQTFTWYKAEEIAPANKLAVDIANKDDITGKYLTTYDATTGTITLTFNNNIDVSSVCKGEFEIAYIDTANDTIKALIITDMTVIDNVIQIKVSNAPTGSQVSGNDKIEVTLKSYPDEAGVVYTLTTENGQQFSATGTITIMVDESKPGRDTTLAV